MLKLYKRDGNRVQYWEAWNHDNIIVVHRGIVGTRGESVRKRLRRGRDAETLVAELALEPRGQGYRELDRDEHTTFVVHYRCDGWGSAEDLEKRYLVEDAMNECLGWTGNGHCDGGDIGSGSINVFCFVVDPHLAVRAAIEDFRQRELLEGAVMAYRRREDDFTVIWPEDFNGTLSIL